jgi:ankyrin repeat protein
LLNGKTREAIALLRDEPALLESVDRLEQTPLHMAAALGRTDAVAWMLDHGAKVNAIAYNDFSALHLAANAEIARLLIRAGADESLIDVWGNTPLQKAAEESKTAVVDAILASGYPIDLRTAVMLKRRDLVKKMVREDPAVAANPSATLGLWGGATRDCYRADQCGVGW